MSDFDLPDGWQWVKLGQVCEVIMGQSPTGASYNLEGIGVPLLNGPTEFGPIYPTAIQWTNEPTKFAEPNDILFCVRGATTGRKNFADQRYCIGRGLAAIRAMPDLASNEFITYVLDLVATDILGETAGSTFPNLPGEKLKNFPIPLPPLDEQRRIAAILYDEMAAVEAARAAAEAQLVAAESLAAAYLREVFESEEAQEWELFRLGDIATTTSGTTPSRSRPEYFDGGTIPWVKTGELRDNVIYDTEEHVIELALRETSLRLLPIATLLIAMYGQGQTRGRTALLGVSATINQACFAIQPNEECFDTTFLQYWFRYSYSRLREQTEGRGGNQPNLNGQLLNDEFIPLPSILVQQAVSEQLAARYQVVDEAAEALRKQLGLVNTLPAALLRQAFKGEM